MSKRTKTKGRANALCLFAHIELILNLCLSDISLGNLLEYVEHPCALTSHEYRCCVQRFKPWRTRNTWAFDRFASDVFYLLRLVRHVRCG